MSFWEFIKQLRENDSRFDDPLADKTFDLLIERFVNIPGASWALKKGGPDCRYQYKAYLNSFFLGQENKSIKETTLKEIHDQEKKFRNLVYRHFIWCKHEAKKKQDGWNRYHWDIGGITITVYMPIQLPGRQRKKWLEENIPDVDPTNADEKERIQTIINQSFGWINTTYGLDDYDRIQPRDNMDPNKMKDSILGDCSTNQLRVLIANEKADGIDFLRPCIKKIGPPKVRELVRRILEELEDESYQPSRLGAAFGLTPTCMSNFAGKDKDWSQGIPDLFMNIAQFLATKQEFREAAKKAGVWQTIEAIIQNEGEAS